MDVGGWLRGLGLGQYEEKFRDNKIDADLLPRLTVDDLKDIGVSVVGDRRRLLDAIAVIAGAGPASPAKSTPSKGVPASAERRPITVMFCDLVGSTSLAAKLDAEDWRNLVNAYLDEATKAVTGLGGHVLKKLGDGLMALFGYPQAQENDAERAVRAALAIQRALSDLNARNAVNGAPELSARIGIECGSVVVDATGEVFGEAPNVAARVQAAAEPGSVLVTGSVQRQVAGLFVVEEKGAHGFKGVAQPLSLYRVVRASGGGRRGGLRALTQFVGREEELGFLARRWKRVRAGEGQLVLIVGEPGLGKSRLIEEFHSRLAETRHTWVEWSASQLLQNTPLHPIAEWGRFRFGADAPAEQRLADLEGTLRLIGLGPAEYAPLLAPLVDIPLPLGRAAHFPPEELRRKQLAAMTAWVLAGARSQPVVLAFEDLHWADPTSLDLLRALADRGAQAPLLLLATTRPEFRAPWSLRPHHSLISLSPLDRAGVARMVGEISARHALSKELIEGVNERTGGVPLFVEEVTRLLVERGEQGSVQAIPPTLQLSLAARLDRLGPAREVAQIGAVLGRDFVYVLLRNVAEIEEPALQASLDRLADADLLFVEGAPPEANYRFKHALIQDAAYESLLKSRRQALHRRAAEALREANGEPEAIAHHFTEAGLDDVAIEWWGKAGDQALRRSAFQEAISHLGKAIAMADKATGAASRPNAGDATASRQRVKLQVDYSEAIMYYKGFSAEETRVAWARAAELGANRDDFSERSAVRHAQWTLAIVRGELRAAQELASTFLREAEEAGRPVEAGVAHRSLGVICYYSGDFLNARIHCERALDACRHERDFEARERFSDDTGAVAMSILAITSWHLGEVERASELINMANHRAAELDHAPSKVHPLYWKSILEILRGDAAAALITGEALEGICGEHGMGEWRAVAEMVVGWAHGRLANPAAGAAEMRQALAVLINKGMRIVVVFFQGLLADLELETLGADSAVARIDEALVSADQSTNFASLPFLHRLRGDTLLQRNPPNIAPAEDAYRTAIAIANRQGARSYELLASLSLAKLHRSTGRLVEAQAVLGPALEGFSPTLEMPEIAEAQALLAALSETEEMKTAVAQRERRLRLQTDYGRAVMYSRGFAAAETKSAFARAMELAARTDDFSARFSAFDGQCRSAIVRGELRSAWELASSFLREAEGSERLPETAAARRSLGLIAYFLGDFVAARGHLQQALHECDTEHDEEAWERFGDDTGAVAMSYLALTTWQLGEVERARELIDTANQRAAKIGHGPSKAIPLYWMSYLEILRGDPKAALCTAEALAALGQAHAMTHFSNMAELNIAWAHGRLADPAVGCSQFQKAFEAHLDHGFRIGAGFYTGLLAELEAETLGAERGLARIDEALLLADQVEYRCDLAFLHRLRGEILLKVDPGKPAPAEEAFQTAVAAAKQQGARSLGLQAAVSLAKLYQSTSRPADAHAVLAPALEGFSPRPEMPEIAEAQALLVAIEAGAHVRH